MRKLVFILASVLIICLSVGTCTIAETNYSEGDLPYDDLIWYTKDRMGRPVKNVHTAIREIIQASKIGILVGYPAEDDEQGRKLFKPNEPIKRSEFIKSLIVLATNRTFDFNNINSRYSEWYGPYVTIAEMQGIIDKGQYSKEELDEPITRIEMIFMLAKTQINMKGIEQFQLGKISYTDIDYLTKDEKDLVLHAAQYDLLEGMKEGVNSSLEPNKQLTRGEAAVAFMRIY